MMRAINNGEKFLMLEGNFDQSFFSKLLREHRIRGVTLLNLHEENIDVESNKDYILGFVNEYADDYSNLYAFVDADYDFAVDSMNQPGDSILPYSKNIFDTSPATDLDTKLISYHNVENYLQSIGCRDSEHIRILAISSMLGCLRYHKHSMERSNHGVVYANFSGLLKNLTSVTERVSFESLVGALKKESKSMGSLTKKYFEKMMKKGVYEDTLANFQRKGLAQCSYIRGHDIMEVICAVKGWKKIHKNILEKELIKSNVKNSDFESIVFNLNQSQDLDA